MNPENLIRAAFAAASVVYVGVAFKNYRKVVRTERQKRVEIRLETEKELYAIRRSSQIIQQKIANGDYDPQIGNGRIVEQLAVDQKFYTMAERFNG